jgi:proteic killer suppression protein
MPELVVDIEYRTNDLERLVTDPSFNGGYPQAVVKSYRAKVQFIRGATDERDLYAMKSFAI